MTRTAAELIATAILPAREFVVVSRGESIGFKSTFMDDVAMDILQYIPGNFARSLWESSHNRGLSERQLAWAHKLAMDYKKYHESEVSDDNETPQFSALFAAFKAAKDRGAKRMKMRFNGIALAPNRDNTALWVTSLEEYEDGAYGPKPKYLGKVTRSGMDSRLSDTVKETIMAAASNPLMAAVRYGKDTGECSCCGRELTNAESIRLGIGPICREKFGL